MLDERYSRDSGGSRDFELGGGSATGESLAADQRASPQPVGVGTGGTTATKTADRRRKKEEEKERVLLSSLGSLLLLLYLLLLLGDRPGRRPAIIRSSRRPET